VIQPIETAVVRKIHVTDGQQVKPGDVLVELDDTSAVADTLRLANDLTAARLQVVRMQTFLAAMEDGVSPIIIGIDGIEAARIAQEQRLLDGQYAEFRAKLSQLDADIVKREFELRSTQEIVKKLEQTMVIARRRAEDFKGLVEKNFVARHGYLEREQERIEQEADLATQRSRINELKAVCTEARHRQASFLAETRRTTLDHLNEAEQKAIGTEQELLKAETRARLMKLTAPVEGTVQQLAVHTVGGVVTSAQPLMMIVPKDNALEVEVFVENKDIGFINAGQGVEIKLETFPFTKYGMIQGQIIQVSNDAINDPKRGLVYSARVRPERTTMQVDGKTVNLSPGMAATAEIKTGSRRLIEYFLSPLIQHGSESLHER
jgi:hemolysin D